MSPYPMSPDSFDLCGLRRALSGRRLSAVASPIARASVTHHLSRRRKDGLDAAPMPAPRASATKVTLKTQAPLSASSRREDCPTAMGKPRPNTRLRYRW
jgi:hypothetical protein